MAYEIREAGKFFSVVATINNGKIVVRYVDYCNSRAEAERLLRDLAGWKF